MLIKNDIEFNTLISKEIANAMDEIVDEILELLQDNIADIVYGGYSPSFYERTYQFLDTWKTNVVGITQGAQGEILYDGSQLSFNADKFQHGNIYGESSADDLAHIIFKGAIGYAFGFPQIGARDAWKEMENTLGRTKSSKIGQIAKTAFARRGLIVI